jgi:hypothetical protein
MTETNTSQEIEQTINTKKEEAKRDTKKEVQHQKLRMESLGGSMVGLRI